MSHAEHPRDLKRNVKAALKSRPDGPLPYKMNTRKAVRGRDARAAEWPDFEERRTIATARRLDDVKNLERFHGQLRDHWSKRGIIVHEASDSQTACEEVHGILRKAGADKLLKSKTMLSEEIGLNDFLESNGITPVETDLGEYIVQLRGESPSHITMPAMHLTRRDVGQLFAERLGVEYTEDPPSLTRIARNVLREEFLQAKVGLCGVNFAVAETGHIATITNEGNGRMVTSLPNVVIALMGWERVTRSLSDLALFWQLIARSATGQRSTVYLNLLHGPSPGVSGPNEVHVVLVDNGRRAIHADDGMRGMLGCIHCGACLNVCPVYQQVGGHPYGGIYPGPMGEVFTPLLLGLDNAPDHPFASTLCGACEEVCPVSIPLPGLLLELRRRQVKSRSRCNLESVAWKVFREVMSDPRRYKKVASMARIIQRLWPGGQPPVPGWSENREVPLFAGKSFRDRYKRQLRESIERYSNHPALSDTGRESDDE